MTNPILDFEARAVKLLDDLVNTPMPREPFRHFTTSGDIDQQNAEHARQMGEMYDRCNRVDTLVESLGGLLLREPDLAKLAGVSNDALSDHDIARAIEELTRQELHSGEGLYGSFDGRFARAASMHRLARAAIERPLSVARDQRSRDRSTNAPEVTDFDPADVARVRKAMQATAKADGVPKVAGMNRKKALEIRRAILLERSGTKRNDSGSP